MCNNIELSLLKTIKMLNKRSFKSIQEIEEILKHNKTITVKNPLETGLNKIYNTSGNRVINLNIYTVSGLFGRPFNNNGKKFFTELSYK